MQEFTLVNLRRFLGEAGYKVTSYADDRHDLAMMRKIPKIAQTLPPPRFFAVVTVEDEDDLLKVSTKLMERTWEVFERGQMEFTGERRGEKIVIRIEQKQDGTARTTSP